MRDQARISRARPQCIRVLKPTFEGTNGAERAGLHSWSADDESYRHQTHGEITGPVGQQDYFASTTGQSRSPINHLISRQ
jgi:hypothetical protein